MQAFHDAHPDVKFAIGETGLSQTSSIEARLAYVEEITSEATMQALPNFIGCTWCEWPTLSGFGALDQSIRAHS